MNAAPLFTLPSPFDGHSGTLYLLEPPDTAASAMRARLLDESYARPFVLDDGECLYLYFSIRLMQSAMRREAPDALELRYTQAMMACLLFKPRPRRLLLIGLGGGSLVKFCHRRLPGTQVVAVELDPDVIAFRDLFRVPADDERLAVVCGDGAAVLAAADKGMDFILVDGFDRAGYAPALAGREFIETAFAKLSGGGILVVNLAGDPASYAGLVGCVMAVFDNRAIVVPIAEDGNHVLYAFRDPAFDPRWRLMAGRSRELKARFGLDFPRFVERLERASKQGIARKLLCGDYI